MSESKETLDVSMFKNIITYSSTNILKGSLHSFLPKSLHGAIGNSDYNELINADQILSCIRSNNLIEMPIGIYTKKSFNDLDMSKLKGKDVRFNHSFLIGIELDGSVDILNSYLVDSKLTGASIFHSNVYQSDENKMELNEVFICESRIPAGAIINDSVVLNSFTTNVVLGNKDENNPVINKIVGGVHNFVKCRTDNIYIEPVKNTTNYLENIPGYLISETNVFNNAGSTYFRLSTETNFIPPHSTEGVEIGCSLRGKVIPDEYLGMKNRPLLNEDYQSKYYVANLINAALKRNRFSHTGVNVDCLYKHSNLKVDASISPIVSKPLTAAEMHQKEVEKLLDGSGFDFHAYKSTLENVVREYTQQLDLFGNSDRSVNSLSINYEGVINYIHANNKLLNIFNNDLKELHCDPLSL